VGFWHAGTAAALAFTLITALRTGFGDKARPKHRKIDTSTAAVGPSVFHQVRAAMNLLMASCE